jgi:acid phosphatase (class A)
MKTPFSKILNLLNLCILTTALTPSLSWSASNYTTRTPESFLSSIKPPPAPRSKEQKLDLDQVLKYQKSRTDVECQLAIRDADVNPPTKLFNPATGQLTQEQYAKIFPFLIKISEITHTISTALKNNYKRLRPYDADPRVNPCAPRNGAFSYPSGHALLGRIFALTLARLNSVNSARYFARGDEIAILRVKGGVHYPSDIAAGKKLADVVWKEFLKDPDFQADLEKYQF